jgi:Tol biopolymer transport system component
LTVEALEDRRLLSGNNSLIVFAAGFDITNDFTLRLDGIFAIRPDGTGLRQLTQSATANLDWEEHGLNLPDDHPALSPDGRQIVFTSNRADPNNWDLYIMNVNGSNVRRLTFSPGLDIEPVFSHDGTKIAWTSARAGDLNIFTMNVDGTNIHQLTSNTLEDIEPAWSPDDKQIAWTRVEDTNQNNVLSGPKDVFIMNADGSNQRQITNTPGQNHDPVFTPDGQFLLISSDRPGTAPPFGDTFKIRVSDGSVVADLNHSVGGIDPNASPDGTQFAFFQGAPELLLPTTLWVANTDGSGTPRMLPTQGLLNVHPNWGPLADSDGDGRPDYLENFNTSLTASTLASNEQTDDSFGTAIGLADLTHDGYPDLVVGIPGRNVSGHADAGQVVAASGSLGGPLLVPNNILIPNNTGSTANAQDLGASVVTGGEFGRAIASGDFNGDGFSDIAIGAPGQKQVFVNTGVGRPWQILSSSEENFGETLAVGDFNGDGFADLAIGAPTAVRTTGSTTAHTGSVSVFYGSSSGLSTTPQVFDGNSATLAANAAGGAQGGDLFGFSLAAGDLNADGAADLVVGVPGRDVNGVANAGLVHIIPGAKGTTLRLGQAVARDARGLPEPYTGLQANARFGEALAIGRFDGNSADLNDLVVGIPREDINSAIDTGLVAVYLGGGFGVIAATPTAFTTADAGGGSTLTTSNFGKGFAVGDFNGDGVPDLAVAADRTTFNGTSEAGRVYLVFSTRSTNAIIGGSPVFIQGGLVPASAQVIDSASVGTGRQTDGHFAGSELFPSGNTLAAADIDRDGQADLVIGEPQADVAGVTDSGLVGIRYGVKVGTFTLAPADATVEAGDRLAYTLTWTHPENWHDLQTLHLRLASDDGTIAWVRWDEASNTFSLLDPETRQFGPAGAPGSDKKLRAGVATLELADTTVVGSGPTGRSVTLTLRLRLAPQTPPGNYHVELLATDDHGNAQGFDQAGVLRLISRNEGAHGAGGTEDEFITVGKAASGSNRLAPFPFLLDPGNDARAVTMDHGAGSERQTPAPHGQAVLTSHCYERPRDYTVPVTLPVRQRKAAELIDAVFAQLEEDGWQ